ncbi:hypothetical protein FHS26_003370 [Rhizobium pisi]|jgi:hypothetical protein|uniref:Uncharacterized protein n=1 Tax=Rhizobium pisi TaxID=574561 RepID=A0A3R9AJ52_9HYPH|nr:DUF6719 family protein [Rhizobium pisi]MBB3135624.1 hypothetical protein [Rhizobium pisi]RSB76106.1 hypothetical protein EFD55_16900 [Rhizobium pisi]TCA58936.1 hypothetical protein E0J16_11270 [Rhizobium pisi]
MRSISVIVSIVALSTFASALPALAAIKTVTQRPTTQSLPAGHAVLFNDGQCPAGQIAKFVHKEKSGQLKKSCVHSN